MGKRAADAEQKEKCDTSFHPAPSVELLKRQNKFAPNSIFTQPKRDWPRPHRRARRSSRQKGSGGSSALCRAGRDLDRDGDRLRLLKAVGGPLLEVERADDGRIATFGLLEANGVLGFLRPAERHLQRFHDCHLLRASLGPSNLLVRSANGDRCPPAHRVL